MLLSKKKHDFVSAAAPWSMLVSVCIWGFGYTVTKVTLNDNIAPVLVTAVSYFYGALGAIPILIWKRKELIKTGVLSEGAALGFLLCVSRILQVIGCSNTTAGKNAFITTAYVIIVPFFMRFLLKEKLAIKNIVTAIMTLVGISLVSVNEKLNGVNFGDMMTLASSIGYALHIVYNGKYAKRHDPWLLGALQLVFAALFSFAAATGTQAPLTPAFFTLKFQGGMLYNGVLGLTIGFAFQSFGQKYVSQSKSAMILSLESVSGALFSAALLQEHFGSRTILGCVIIFTAITISSVRTKDPENIENKAGEDPEATVPE